MTVLGAAGRDRVVGPAVAGAWYPADPEALARMVDELVGEGAPSLRGRPRALVEPHAGYIYSGAVAGKGFRLLRAAAPSRVVLLGPSHYEAFRGACLPDAEAYRTPLGDVPLEREAIAALARIPSFRVSNRPYRLEHSLEAEIPFLQRVLAPGWTLLPVLLGAGTWGPPAQGIADALREWLEADTLLVVSSDFTHFGPRFAYVPFTSNVPQRIEALDRGAIERIVEGDLEGFEAYVQRTGATICGRDAIDVLLRTLTPETRGALVAYDTSGRLTGDWTHSVSYAAIAFPA